MTPERKAMLESYLNGGKGKDKPKDEKDPKANAEAQDGDGIDDEEGMELEGPNSYRNSDDGQEGDLERYGSEEDPADKPTTTDKSEAPRNMDPKARGQRVGAQNREGLRKAFDKARGAMPMMGS